MIISRSVIPRMRNASEKSCRENRDTHLIFNTFCRKRAVCEVMSKNAVEPERPQMKIRRMNITCLIPKATNTHTRMCNNNYCFSTATVVARTRFNVTLNVHCLSCSLSRFIQPFDTFYIEILMCMLVVDQYLRERH